MIRLDNISKQNGHHLLFVEASAALQKGEKVGLVGPNGAGKTTIFRMVTGEEQPDDGQVERPRRLTIGYFRQDVGDLAGRSVLAETVAGAGEVAALGEELVKLEARMAEAGDDMEQVVERYGEVQARYQELGGYEVEARAQEILAGLGLAPEQVAATGAPDDGGPGTVRF